MCDSSILNKDCVVLSSTWFFFIASFKILLLFCWLLSYSSPIIPPTPPLGKKLIFFSSESITSHSLMAVLVFKSLLKNCLLGSIHIPFHFNLFSKKKVLFWWIPSVAAISKKYPFFLYLKTSSITHLSWFLLPKKTLNFSLNNKILIGKVTLSKMPRKVPYCFGKFVYKNLIKILFFF